MNKTVELVNQWAEFAGNHANADLEDFCLYYLSKKRELKFVRPLFEGIAPPIPQVLLTKLLDWIMRLHRFYLQASMNQVPLRHLDEFFILNSIAKLRNPKKTEAIQCNLIEFSTGLNFIASLKAQGYITETDDENDKRSKRLDVTPQGKEVLQQCYQVFGRVSKLIFNDMAPEDIELCTLLLRDVESKFAGIWQKHKGRDFCDIYREMVGEDLPVCTGENCSHDYKENCVYLKR
ncbi:MAG: winged helix DNA-binding protein [Ignavibacteria bacterium]|nr:winged helix DNA-binding protein [Ignavibacteria bacterium]